MDEGFDLNAIKIKLVFATLVKRLSVIFLPIISIGIEATILETAVNNNEVLHAF